MGITGLLPEMEGAITFCHIRNLSGGKAAVDVSGWIYKALGFPDRFCDVNTYVYRRVNVLRYHNIDVTLVFDGPEPPAKKEIVGNRKKAREKRKCIDTEEKTLRRLCSRSGQIQESLKQFCIIHGIAYVQSPFEADSQIAHMVRNGEVNFVISEDSDFIAFGCPKILFEFKISHGELFEQEKFEKCWKAPYDIDVLQNICILIGSDYFKGGLKGFGRVAARRYYAKMFPSFDLNRIIALVKKPVDDQFKEKFKIAVNTFKFQPVYDKTTKTTIPLTPYPEGRTAADYLYAGDPTLSQGDHFDPVKADVKQPVVTNGQSVMTVSPCADCSEVFQTWRERKTHRKEVHPQECEVCQKKFEYKCHLEDHMFRHGEKPTFICMTCGKALWTKASLYVHKLAVHRDDLSACTICGKAFRNSYILASHMWYVHPDGRKHECDTCGAAFKNKRTLASHVIFLHSFERPLKCELCPKAFKRQSILTTHIKSHINERLFICSKCPKAFNLLHHLQYHERIHSGERLYKCQICPKSFTRIDGLQKHKLIHSGIKRYICTVCKRRFLTSDILKYHIRIHTGEKPIKCPYCERAFSHYATRRHHMKFSCEKRPNPDAELPHKCGYCDKRFAYERRKIEHEFTHTGEKHFKCEFCEKEFCSSSGLRLHVSTCGKNPSIISGDISGTPFKCDYCGQGFTQCGSRNLHMNFACRKRPNPDAELPFKCGYCEKRFSTKDQKIIHEMTHTGERPFKCSFCGQGFCNNTQMWLHAPFCNKNPSKVLRDTNEKPFKCEYCGAGFTESGGMRKHMSICGKNPSIRSGEISGKPYECDFCGEGFTTSGSRNKHMEFTCKQRPNQDAQLPHKCGHCEKRFARKTQRDDHERTHTGEKPFKCNFCGQGFGRSNYLRLHVPYCEKNPAKLLRDTGEKPFKCPNCGKEFAQLGSMNFHMRTTCRNKPSTSKE